MNTSKKENILIHLKSIISIHILAPPFLSLLLLILTLLIFWGRTPIYGQSGVKVGILPVINKTNLNYLDALTETVEDNIFFAANQLNSYSIIDGRSENIANPTQLNRLKRIAKKRRCNFLIAGQVTHEQAVYTLTIVLYDAQEEKIKATKESPFYRLIDVFNISDKLSISLLEDLTGTHIKRGTVFFVNQTPGTTFSVTVNKRKLEENPTSVTLIEGKYTIKIYNTTKGKKRVMSQNIKIIEGDPLTIEFDLSRKIVAFDKKNTIRGSIGGLFIHTEKSEDDSNFTLSNAGFIIPALSYSHLFTKNIGFITGLGFVSSPNIFAPRDSGGIEIKAGPHFRFGRLGISPMIGYSALFISSDSNGFDFFDFFNIELLSEDSGSFSLTQTFLIIIGIDFFFTPMFSVFGEAGLSIGQNEKTANTVGVVEKTYLLVTGSSLSFGIAVSF